MVGNLHRSTGLPFDATVAEVVDFFRRCGIIREDAETLLPRVKMYRDAEGCLKGDGLVTYAMPESVKLAITMLDGRDIREGWPIKVEEVWAK